MCASCPSWTHPEIPLLSDYFRSLISIFICVHHVHLRLKNPNSKYLWYHLAIQETSHQQIGAGAKCSSRPADVVLIRAEEMAPAFIREAIFMHPIERTPARSVRLVLGMHVRLVR